MAPPTSPTGPEILERDHRQRMGGLRDNKEYSDRLDIIPSSDIRSALGPNGEIWKPIHIVERKKDRQELQRKVYGSGIDPPTMSIEEYLEEKEATGGIIKGGGAESGKPPEPDEDNYEKGDEETYKARNWDNFTEDNPK